MGYFEHVEKLPADPILELIWEFRRDPRIEKIDLSVGIYYDENLQSSILESVKQAQQKIFEIEKNKTYLPIDGDPLFLQETKKIIFGEKLVNQLGELIYGAQSVGGTGALRVGGEFLSKAVGTSIFLSNPTWENHFKIFAASNLKVETYPYYDFQNQCADFEKMVEHLKKLSPRSIILLHACCHNPTGSDLNKTQWMELSALMLEKQLIPFFDMAYQGFGDSLDEDAFAVRYFAEQVHQMLVAFSYAKICGLYAERVGALFFVGKEKKEMEAAASQIKVIIRSNYSNPPKHGAAIVAAVMGDEALKVKWRQELEKMRNRIVYTREKFAHLLMKESLEKDYSYLLDKKGMFCFTGLDPAQVGELKEKLGIYMTKTGRINLTGLNDKNMSHVVSAILMVTQKV